MEAFPFGAIAIAVVALAYLFVVTEEYTHIRKSKPVLVGAALVWILLALHARSGGMERHFVEQTYDRMFLEFSQLFMFLLVAMTFINSMAERNVFEYLRYWLVTRQLGYKAVFWITGLLAFFISPVADNLTTALLMCAVVLAVGKKSPKFVALACINIVVGANAGGAFSPFGDITTLMVWQREIIPFFGFFELFIPSVVAFVVPAAIMHFAVPAGVPDKPTEYVSMKLGARRVVLLFFLTISITVACHQFLDFPPVFGMLTGLALLKAFGYYLRRVEHRDPKNHSIGDISPFDVFKSIANAEWDTLFFFYGVIACVGGLATFGYLALMSQSIYGAFGPTLANSAIGVISAIIDNIPLMYAVLEMNPPMDEAQWLLVTLTCGIGGSLLSIGSAAGVGLMGQARGTYTFFSHFKWSWAVALGYVAAIYSHLWLSA
jgi:Na+/H+ antiporter NhaD/arsenite permease-like protein